METEQPFMAHLIELRDRVLRIVVVVIAIFLVLFFFANDLYHLVSEPLLSKLPDGSTMIATGVAAPFLTPFKLSLVASIFLAIPYIFYQFWSFVAPGLYNHEKRLALPLIASSVVLFYSGIAFSFYIVFPLMFAFFTATTPEGVAMMTDISQYLDFILKMFFAFGVAFEVPVFTIVLTITGVTNADKLAEKRPYVIVGSFVIGMLLTPPDIVSQTLLAIPVWLLFELGIIFSRIIGNRKTRKDKENNVDNHEPSADNKPSADNEPVTENNESAAENEPRYKPMTDDEMEAELDAIEREEER
ncbi:MAG: twin-arginine translocase subunit TatC [gamma proteobacterium symbiont of Bathyaustriella thionipta]|nr:twin-arginine translocase subunit TatC [gamma proteobacterium symbiont of Bathyaustriella thionipta]MCU7949781.1 twin-arginine translocase subunit TatC [gamma proteobacterium symbiont of Bathyaustriella thionipta]MCU7951995.1 twin-arginine translocase subunit TatC [gamma proteobacterium symbiont of Bathyaustriella thionipta]MCU7956364.1 twin-arginine translocase subunit TatC [gamma proteobacterium symbiont of Bathyaustriella thionipta]MCU7968721.1 twin-arginine translocase subunit TatC [gamm